MNMKTITLWSALAVSVPSCGVWGQAKVGTAGAQFLEVGISARAVAMGEAFTSIVDDASSVYYNPAGLALVPGREVMVSHVLYVADINYSFVALAFPVDKLGGTVGVAAYYMDIGQMDVVDQPFSIPPSSP